MNPVESYIEHLEGEEKEIASYLHDLFTHRYGMTHKLRYKIPFYDIKKWLCYLNPIKKQDQKKRKNISKIKNNIRIETPTNTIQDDNHIGRGIELCFLHGRWMKDPQGVLNANGRVQISGITYKNLKDIDENVLDILIEEAIEIDERFSQLKKLPK